MSLEGKREREREREKRRRGAPCPAAALATKCARCVTKLIGRAFKSEGVNFRVYVSLSPAFIRFNNASPG